MSWIQSYRVYYTNISGVVNTNSWIPGDIIEDNHVINWFNSTRSPLSILATFDLLLFYLQWRSGFNRGLNVFDRFTCPILFIDLQINDHRFLTLFFTHLLSIIHRMIYI